MLNVTRSATSPDVYTLEKRDSKIDIWMRKNIREVTETVEEVESTYFEYDEAFATFENLAAPTASMIEADFDGWFSMISAWSPDGGTSAEKLRADIDFIAIMADIPLN